MVSNLSFIFMGISISITLLVTIGTLFYFRKKEKISKRPIIIGALTFIIFTQFLEQGLHLFVIQNNLFTTAISFSIYGALAAGIFEELGRFAMFKLFLNQNRQWKDGIAFGIGHGGIEALLVGVMTTINTLAMSVLINAGTLEETLGSTVPAQSIADIKATLTGPSSVFLAVGFERIFAFIIQIALTLLVLYAVRYRKNLFLILAILLHALIDVPAALYQTGIITNVWVAEMIILIFAIIGLVYIIKSEKVFTETFD